MVLELTSIMMAALVVGPLFATHKFVFAFGVEEEEYR